MPSKRSLIVIATALAAYFAISAIARQYLGDQRCAAFDMAFHPDKGCIAKKPIPQN